MAEQNSKLLPGVATRQTECTARRARAAVAAASARAAASGERIQAGVREGAAGRSSTPQIRAFVLGQPLLQPYHRHRRCRYRHRYRHRPVPVPVPVPVGTGTVTDDTRSNRLVPSDPESSHRISINTTVNTHVPPEPSRAVSSRLDSRVSSRPERSHVPRKEPSERAADAIPAPTKISDDHR